MFLRGVVFSCVLLSSSCSVSFILRDKVLSVVRESKTCSLLNGVQCFLQSWKWPFCTNCSVRCTMCRSHVLSSLTSNQFELQRSLIRINISFALIFRTSSPWNLETFIRTSCLQNLGHLVFRIFMSLDAGDVHQNFCLQNLQHLNRNTIFRSWECSSELPVSESPIWFLGKSSELSEADCLHD